uniref:Sodium-dependent glucose transporter 1-like n=1 Tax=Saccoglossus kowalevskii TaxID=10224 RepID=A0ABM0MH78_SACKO|nr:PREDICTED: sodium-dependent glucose transporter 1-like [Saccoglossus kowalevskii]
MDTVIDYDSDKKFNLYGKEFFGIFSEEDTYANETVSPTLWVPYTIVAAVHFTSSIPLFIFYFTGPRGCMLPKAKTHTDDTSVSSFNKPVNPNTRTTKESTSFRIGFLFLLSIFYVLYVGHEVIYGGYIYSFAMESDLGFSTEMASLLTSVFWASFAVSRGLNIIVAKYLTPKTMLILDHVGILTADVILVIWGAENMTILWLGTILLGVSIASVYATGITWAENYITLTGKATSVFSISAAMSGILLPWWLGYAFEAYSVMILMYVMLALTIGMSTFFIILLAVARIHGKKPNIMDDITTGAGNYEDLTTTDLNNKDDRDTISQRSNANVVSEQT